MPMCINCGSDKVERQGDDFTCHKCQFQWDVAFEQANKVYLRAQGRQPATSVLENPVNAASGTLTALGQTDGTAVTGTVDRASVVAIPTSTPVATAAQPAGEDQTSDAAAASAVTLPDVVTLPNPPSGSVSGGAAGESESPSADPLPKAAATPAPDVRPPSKGKKG